jgi:hypothetical protein
MDCYPMPPAPQAFAGGVCVEQEKSPLDLICQPHLLAPTCRHAILAAMITNSLPASISHSESLTDFSGVAQSSGSLPASRDASVVKKRPWKNSSREGTSPIIVVVLHQPVFDQSRRPLAVPSLCESEIAGRRGQTGSPRSLSRSFRATPSKEATRTMAVCVASRHFCRLGPFNDACFASGAASCRSRVRYQARSRACPRRREIWRRIA